MCITKIYSLNELHDPTGVGALGGSQRLLEILRNARERAIIRFEEVLCECRGGKHAGLEVRPITMAGWKQKEEGNGELTLRNLRVPVAGLEPERERVTHDVVAAQRPPTSAVLMDPRTGGLVDGVG